MALKYQMSDEFDAFAVAWCYRRFSIRKFTCSLLLSLMSF